jgi:ssDNA-binding Zn-finger/Zn-ribbon topoisomerase 1
MRCDQRPEIMESRETKSIKCWECDTGAVRFSRVEHGVDVWRCDGCRMIVRSCPQCGQDWAQKFKLRATDHVFFYCSECEAMWPHVPRTDLFPMNSESCLNAIGAPPEGGEIEEIIERK